MSKISLDIQDLGKRYRIGEYRPLLDLFTKMSSKQNSDTEFWALRDINLRIEHGETVGVIGPNGAGKSTLLKILSGITYPTTGLAEIYGRVGCLLEVGTGFHPDLTGRENVFMNGAILGLTQKEMREKFDEIVDFAEVDEFIDTPVKRYSSGMRLRLAFSVAAHLEPEILIVDEVLAVGDAAFQRKCLGKLEQVGQTERTVLFVSHNMAAIRNLCSRTVLLEHGRLIFDGSVEEGINRYLDVFAGGEENPIRLPAAETGIASLLELSIRDKDGSYCTDFDWTEEVSVCCRVNLNDTGRNFASTIRVMDQHGTTMFWLSDDRISGVSPLANCGTGVFDYSCTLPGRTFRPGSYFVSWGATKVGEGRVFDHANLIQFSIENRKSGINTRANNNRIGVMLPELKWGEPEPVKSR